MIFARHTKTKQKPPTQQACQAPWDGPVMPSSWEEMDRESSLLRKVQEVLYSRKKMHRPPTAVHEHLGSEGIGRPDASPLKRAQLAEVVILDH